MIFFLPIIKGRLWPNLQSIYCAAVLSGPPLPRVSGLVNLILEEVSAFRTLVKTLFLSHSILSLKIIISSTLGFDWSSFGR